MNKTRVYLFTGFLESGKSSFIQDTLLEQGFGEDEKTLIIACEEGEVAFDIPALEKENASVEFIENEEDLNYETLLHLHQKYQPTQVMIEYNGMWDNTKSWMKFVLINGKLFKSLQRFLLKHLIFITTICVDNSFIMLLVVI